jgi:hypothetical protein
MTNILEMLDQDLGSLATEVRRSLVEVSSGRQSSGAGTIWHPEGLIITNAHVVRTPSPRVTLPDGSTRTARVLARDSGIDAAVLLVEASRLPTVELGNSRGLRPGQWVMALGHPWGVPGAATAGVVIGTGQDMPEMPLQGREWIAVGLHLRPGHSGGPLVDAQGRLVGINTMMIGPEVGMAVPVHVVKEFLRRELGTPRSTQAVAAKRPWSVPSADGRRLAFPMSSTLGLDPHRLAIADELDVAVLGRQVDMLPVQRFLQPLHYVWVGMPVPAINPRGYDRRQRANLVQESAGGGGTAAVVGHLHHPASQVGLAAGQVPLRRGFNVPG